MNFFCYYAVFKAIIEFSNLRYNLAADAINRVLTLSQIHLPSDINNIDLILDSTSYLIASNAINITNIIKKEK